MQTHGETGVPVRIVILLGFTAMLVAYKTRGAVGVLSSAWRTGTIASRPGVVAFGKQVAAIGALDRSVNYFLVIWPALVFGILIAAAVRAFVSPNWFARLLKGNSVKTQLAAGLAGAPLMLCSCCIAPVFTSVAQSSLRLAPALGLMLASPALNPAALALTFMLFEPSVALSRVFAGLIAVLAIGPAVEQMFPHVQLKLQPRSDAAATGADPSVLQRLLSSVGVVSLRTVPGLVIGVVISMMIVQRLPDQFFTSPANRTAAILITAIIAVPLALPTFLEIPLALSLLSVGFPAGAAVALLFAGPAVNLPSLISVARVSGWKVAAAVAGLVWIVAAGAGLLTG
jgi:uncharacterized membrane protein YraQ (UPF0718 family)